MKYSEFIAIVQSEPTEAIGSTTSSRPDKGLTRPVPMMGFPVFGSNPVVMHAMLLQMAWQKARAELTTLTQIKLKVCEMPREMRN